MERALRLPALSSKEADRSCLSPNRRPLLSYKVSALPRFRVQAGNRPINHSPPAPKESTRLRESISSPLTLLVPPVNEVFHANKATVAITAVLLGVAVVAAMLRPTNRNGGSVADLVKRGQLRSDRTSNFGPLKYEDPFNNPMVKVSNGNSVVKMHGKAFKLQAVTLTQEKMVSHQNRRVQAYQWKRPTVFLVEGEQIPDGVDPDTVRWIPPNHPFATAQNDFDEVAAEKNVYQTRGVPSRVRAEHEALRRRMLEASEKGSEMGVPVLDPMAKGESKRALSEQPDSCLGSRPIKPFET